MYLIKWHFMKGICTFLFTVCLVLDSVWLILAMIMRRQMNPEKYRDDVECDKTRKERLNLENIIVFAIFWAIVCALVSNLAVSTTKYMYKTQMGDKQVAASELKMADDTAGSSEDEYQKIMALHVLAKLNSPKLEAYLERAKQSDYKWLRKNAEELSAKYN